MTKLIFTRDEARRHVGGSFDPNKCEFPTWTGGPRQCRRRPSQTWIDDDDSEWHTCGQHTPESIMKYKMTVYGKTEERRARILEAAAERGISVE